MAELKKRRVGRCRENGRLRLSTRRLKIWITQEEIDIDTDVEFEPAGG